MGLYRYSLVEEGGLLQDPDFVTIFNDAHTQGLHKNRLEIRRALNPTQKKK